MLDGIVGARPNLMKMAPLARALAEDGTFELRLVHTGQHYDSQMSGSFFDELGLPPPAVNLEVGSGRQGQQTARILEAYEDFLLRTGKPRGVIVVGDVNSTVACALAAAKLQIPVAHVEAGLRSFDHSMPEEINRILTDALCEILLVSDPSGLIQLAREGYATDRIHFVGNIMVDSLVRELPQAESSTVLADLGIRPQQYVYVTLHRPANVDSAQTLRPLMDLVQELAEDIPFVFAVHPRTAPKLAELGFSPGETRGGLRFIDPQPYRANLRLIQAARAVFTDSGGIQEESSVLQVPCFTVRPNTERPVTVELGSSEIVGSDPGCIRDAWRRLCAGVWKKAAPIPLWDGHTAPRIVRVLRGVWA